MIPFLHIGSFAIPTFGLMVATALLVAAYVLQADFDRHRAQFVKSGYLKEGKEPSHHDEGFLIIGVAGLAGIVGARLYHVLETPRELMADPSMLISRFGFAWFGGFLGGFVALAFLARNFKIPTLTFMDLASPAAAVGYAIGRIGCLLSGDGDYGVPTTLPWGMSFPNGVVPTIERVHPTPIYESLIWLVIALILWRIGKGRMGSVRPAGEVFRGYLIFTGVARFLIEFIRVNPRLVIQEGQFHWIPYEAYSRLASHPIISFSNAQTASLVSIVIGIVLMLRIRSAPQKAN